MGGLRFAISALPTVIDAGGEVQRLPGSGQVGESVFRTDLDAFGYMVSLAARDLQYRGFRDERVDSFRMKQSANFLLYRSVRECADFHEYECLRQSWDRINRPQRKQLSLSPEQQAALDRVKEGLSYEDEEARRQSKRWLYLKGPPGSGKSATLLEMLVWASQTVEVLLICPTGFLVHQYKSQLPEGTERVRVDTIQGVLNYKRRSDGKVTWAPPSVLRRMDLILADEGSQYEDQEWERFFTSIKEQPHYPFVCTVADFQQLQPVNSGGLCSALSCIPTPCRCVCGMCCLLCHRLEYLGIARPMGVSIFVWYLRSDHVRAVYGND